MDKKKKKKRMSYRRKIKYIQIGAITFAVFLLLILSAIGLTRVWENYSANHEATAQAAGTDTGTVESADGSGSGGEDAADGDADASSGDAEEATVLEAEATATASITISAIGDCTLGQDADATTVRNFDAFYIVQKTSSYFFQNVADIFSEDDLTIANLEGPLTTSTSSTGKSLEFKGDPKYTAVLTDGNVDAVNLANDHSHDYGDTAYTDTITNLDNAGITSFGYDRTQVLEVNGLYVGLVGINELDSGIDCQTQLLENLQAVNDQGVDLVIVSFHWGEEGVETPDETMQTLAHLAIDNGADLVLGTHAHVLQGIEVYNGKNIVYGLGNFVYGGDLDPTDTDTIIFQQTFSFVDGRLSSDNTTNIIPCTITSSTGYNDFSPSVLEGTEAERVLQRVETLSAALNGDSSGEDAAADTTDAVEGQ